MEPELRERQMFAVPKHQLPERNVDTVQVLRIRPPPEMIHNDAQRQQDPQKIQSDVHAVTFPMSATVRYPRHVRHSDHTRHVSCGLSASWDKRP